MTKQKALPNPISATEQQSKIETEFTKLMTDKNFQPQTQERYLTQLRCLFQNTPPNPTEQQLIEFLRNGRNNLLTKAVIKLYCKASKKKTITIEKVTGTAGKKGLPKYYTDEQFQRLIELIETHEGSDKLSLFLQVSRATGLRKNEALNIKKKDIDWQTGKITIIGKRNKTGFVFLPSHMIPKIQQVFTTLKDEDAYFKTIYKSGNNLSNYLRRYIIKGRFEKAGHHIICRHSFATNLRKAGVEIDDVSRMLRHQSINTTMIYIDFNDKDIKNMWEKAREKTNQ